MLLSFGRILVENLPGTCLLETDSSVSTVTRRDRTIRSRMYALEIWLALAWLALAWGFGWH